MEPCEKKKKKKVKGCVWALRCFGPPGCWDKSWVMLVATIILWRSWLQHPPAFAVLPVWRWAVEGTDESFLTWDWVCSWPRHPDSWAMTKIFYNAPQHLARVIFFWLTWYFLLCENTKNNKSKASMYNWSCGCSFFFIMIVWENLYRSL